MTNLELFKYSGKNPEPLIDKAYVRDEECIIPISLSIKDSSAKSLLVEKNTRLIQLISTFCYLREKGREDDCIEVHDLISEVIEILTKIENINLSPFSQFFLVYDTTYDSFLEYSLEEQKNFIRKILCAYCDKRHSIYLSHGYTNTILQVVKDSYSHKGNSTAGIDKVKKILNNNGFRYKEKVDDIGDKYYFFPDKGGSNLFSKFVKEHKLKAKFVSSRQGKLPDIVLRYKDEYYIIELKHIKSSGGGQDKQLSEIIDFVGSFEDDNSKVHFVSYLDGLYSNKLHNNDLWYKKKAPDKLSKIGKQYDSIKKNLEKNKGNYFLNTKGLEKFMRLLVEGKLEESASE